MGPFSPAPDSEPPARRLNILMVGLEWFTDNPGGGGRYMTDAAVGLVRRGHRVTVVVPRQHPGLAASEWIDGVRVERFPLAGPLDRLRGSVQPLARLLAEEGPFDVVHSHFALFGLAPLYHPALARARRVCQFQGPWAAESAVEGAGRLGRTSKWLLERLAYARCDAFIVLSRAFKTLLARDYRIDPERIRVIPAAVDLDRFRPAADRQALRAALGLEAGPVLLAVRRLVKRMGLEVLIDAFSRIAPSYPGSLLLLGGSGPLQAELAYRASALGVADRVRFLGRLSDEELVRYDQAADLTVVPTVALEGFGLVTVESLACGTPVVGTAEGGTAEILAPFSPRLLVPPGDVEALASKLEELLSGETALPSRERCRAYAEAHYTWDHVLDQLEAVLKGD